jgi:6-phosphogluconolactonase (cycloisomerase 2 family)
LIRIYSINQASGQLTSCPDLNVKGGTGPRHAAFWVPSSGATMMYVANELANTVNAFSVTYPKAGCLSFALEQSLTGYAGNRSAVAGTKLGEIHVKDNFVYTTNRNDKSFSQNDSISSFAIGSNGLLTYLASTSTGGTYARTFAINTEGDLVAIGDQTTSNVVIVTRDTKTGLLGLQVASLRIGNAGTPENEDGLSSVLWDQ